MGRDENQERVVQALQGNSPGNSPDCSSMTLKLSENHLRNIAYMKQSYAKRAVGAPYVPLPEPDLAKLEDRGKRGGGPKTAEGKARSAMNSTKHGLYSEDLLFESEDEHERFEHHVARYEDLFSPRDVFEEDLVDQIVTLKWKIKHAYAAEAEYQAETEDYDPNKYLRAISQAERSLTRAVKELQLYRAGKLEVQPPKEGSSQRHDAPDPQPNPQANRHEPLGSDPYDDTSLAVRPCEDVPNPTGHPEVGIDPPAPSHPPFPPSPRSGCYTPDDAKHLSKNGCWH